MELAMSGMACTLARTAAVNMHHNASPCYSHLRLPGKRRAQSTSVQSKANVSMQPPYCISEMWG